jgi:hypothetical protein
MGKEKLVCERERETEGGRVTGERQESRGVYIYIYAYTYRMQSSK